jgi:HEAT repeat protein
VPGKHKWTYKVFVFTRSEGAERRGPSEYRFRRGSIEDFQIPLLKESLAKLSAMVKGRSRGALDINFVLEFDPEPARWLLASGEKTPFGEEFVRDWIGPRVNGGAFDAEDGVNRGPYHGILFVHAGLVDPLPLTSVRGMPVSGVSFYTRSALADGDRLALSLYSSWLRQLSWRVRQAGYQTPVWSRSIDNPFATGPYDLITPGMWPNVLQLKERASDEYSAARYPKASAPKPLRDVEADPFSGLPSLSIDEAGVPASKVASVEALLQGQRHRSVFFTSGSGSRFVTPLSRAPFLSDAAQDKFQLRAVGILYGTGVPAVVFQTAVPVQSELALAVTPPAGAGPAFTTLQDGAATFIGDPDQLPTGGSLPTVLPTVASLPLTLDQEGVMRVEQAVDAEKGSVLRISERGFFRSGVAWLFGDRQSAIDVGTQRYLQVDVRQSGRDPFALQLDFENGRRAWIIIGGAFRVPVAAIDRDEIALSVPGQPVNQWRALEVDLAPLAERTGSSRVVKIAVTPEPYYEYYERQQLEIATLELANLKFSAEKNPSAEDAPPVDSDLSAKIEKIGQLDAITPESMELLKTALEDPNRRLKAAACEVLTRLKAPELLASLQSPLRSSYNWVGVLAVRALAFQDTPEAWTMIRRSVEIGPFDHTRFAALQELGRNPKPDYTGTISLAYAANGWSVRQMAVEALTKVKTREANIISVTFLREVEPIVRLAVASSADPTFDLAARRLLYVAVNDPSEEVRMIAATRLLGATAPEIRKDAVLAARDDSPYVREAVLKALAANPIVEGAKVVTQGLKDSVWSVRAAAYQAVLAYEKELSDGTVDILAGEIDPRAHVALQELFKNRKLPAKLKATLSASTDKAVRDWATKAP